MNFLSSWVNNMELYVIFHKQCFFGFLKLFKTKVEMYNKNKLMQNGKKKKSSARKQNET